MRKAWWIVGGLGVVGAGVYLILQSKNPPPFLLRLFDSDPVEPPSNDGYAPPAKKEQAIAAALQEWAAPVQEPDGTNWREIDKYIRGEQGLSWRSADKDALGSNIAYTRNRQFSWCGAFQAWVWGQAGLKHDIRYNYMASLRRIHRWARDTARLIPPNQIQRGDIVSVGELGGPDFGRHMAMALADASGGYVQTIEGNATGEGPSGRRYEGVTKNIRPVAQPGQSGGGSTYYVLYGVRFLSEDFDNA